MHVQVVKNSNSVEYLHLLEQNHLNRHKMFVERMGWEELRRPDKMDIDEYDNTDATHLILVDADKVQGGARFTELTRANLLMDKFSHLIERDLPDTLDKGLDWTRHYVNPRRRSAGRLSLDAAVLYSSAMEYAISQDKTFFTFVSSVYMVELLTSFRWNVTPLGMPQVVGGQPTIAGTIEVSEEALFHMGALNGLKQSYLRPKFVHPADQEQQNWEIRTELAS